MERSSRRALEYYLLASPAFALLDFALGWNVRISAATPTWFRLIYYVIAFLAGLAIRRWPQATTGVAAGEGLANISILVVSLWSKYFGFLATTLDGDVAPNPFTSEVIINAMLSAAVLLIAGYRRLSALQKEHGLHS